MMAPAAAPAIPWPQRLLQIFAWAGVSVDDYEPLESKFDDWARARRKACPALRRPVPGEVEDDVVRFVGFHATKGKGLRGILQMKRLKSGPASYNKNSVYAKGFLAWDRGGDDADRHSDGEVQRVLNKIRESSVKHECGVIIEVSMWGIHKPCRNVEEECTWAGKPHCLTRFRDHNGSRWSLPSKDALVRALWVDLKWQWE